MKKVLLAGVALVAVTAAGVASAADLPNRRTVAPAYVPPVFTWTGFYAGVNAGYAFNGDSDLKDVSINNVFIGNINNRNKSDDGSFTGGGQVGYNYQMGSIVLGLEADFNYINLDRKSNWYVDNFTTDQIQARSKVEWFGTVRPRIGFIPMDRLMVFATGGLAYGQVKTSASYNILGTDVLGGSKSDTRVGWTLGAGAEYAITDNLTVKGEYAYVDLGDKRRSWTNLSGDTISLKDETNFHVVRAGLNYKF